MGLKSTTNKLIPVLIALRNDSGLDKKKKGYERRGEEYNTAN